MLQHKCAKQQTAFNSGGKLQIMQRSDFHAISASPSLTIRISGPGYGDQGSNPDLY